MDLAVVMHAQTRDTLALRQAERDPCPSRRAYATHEAADRHKLRGMQVYLCQQCYRFHSGPKAKVAASAADALFARLS